MTKWNLGQANIQFSQENGETADWGMLGIGLSPLGQNLSVEEGARP